MIVSAVPLILPRAWYAKHRERYHHQAKKKSAQKMWKENRKEILYLCLFSPFECEMQGCSAIKTSCTHTNIRFFFRLLTRLDTPSVSFHTYQISMIYNTYRIWTVFFVQICIWFFALYISVSGLNPHSHSFHICVWWMSNTCISIQMSHLLLKTNKKKRIEE